MNRELIRKMTLPLILFPIAPVMFTLKMGMKGFIIGMAITLVIAIISRLILGKAS